MSVNKNDCCGLCVQENFNREDGKNCICKRAASMSMREKAQRKCICAMSSVQTKLARINCNERGQGTTEYAILVGVLVVIAILAITVFRGKIQELWNNISDGINNL